jgi:hypothetical protein
MPPLYTASVPVFLHYLDRAEGLLGRLRHREAVLTARLAPDMFTTGQQLATASGFALRVAFPLAGQAVPVLADPAPDLAGLRARIGAVRAALAALDPAAFAGAEARRIRHRAGFAELDQDDATFLHLFGMPNFLFHTCMAFAILRSQGIEIGKADFDGLHDCPHGFRFLHCPDHPARR